MSIPSRKLTHEDSPTCLGRGGFGAVYLARYNGADVAVKCVNDLANPDAAAQFREEYALHLRLAASMDGICRILGMCEGHPTFKTCFVMRRYKMSLLDEINASRSDDGGLTPRGLAPVRLLRVGARLAETLATLHTEHKLIVADLKPSNVLISEDGDVVISDFGVSRIVTTSMGAIGFSASQVGGTFNYKSPEQLGGRSADGAKLRVTIQSDAWSFACTMVHMLTGFSPWWDTASGAPESHSDVIGHVVWEKRAPPELELLDEDATPAKLRELLASCFSFKAALRPSFSGGDGIAAKLGAMLSEQSEAAAARYDEPEPVPRDWGDSPYDMLLPLDETCDELEWSHVEGLLRDSLPQARLVKLSKVRNEEVWQRVNRQRRHMAASDNEHVMELWHHTCKTPAEIMYGGPYGFEPAFAIPSSDDDRHKFASYGLGAYFAKEAIYSHWYGHVFQGGPCNMILAEVLTGTSLDLGEAYGDATHPDLTGMHKDTKIKNIRVAPLKSDGQPYDSLNGTEGNLEKYIENSHLGTPRSLIRVGVKMKSAMGRLEGMSEEQATRTALHDVTKQLAKDGARYGRQYVIFKYDRAYPKYFVEYEIAAWEWEQSPGRWCAFDWQTSVAIEQAFREERTHEFKSFVVDPGAGTETDSRTGRVFSVRDAAGCRAAAPRTTTGGGGASGGGGGGASSAPATSAAAPAGIPPTINIVGRDHGRRAACMGQYTLRTLSGVTPPVYRRDKAPHRLLFRDDEHFWRVATVQSSGTGSLRSERASATIEGVMIGKSMWMFRNAVGAGFTLDTNIQLCVVATPAVIAAFWQKMNKKDMTDVVVPYGVTEIPEKAFEYCGRLASVVMPVTVRKIGFRAFAGCSSLAAFVIPDSVTTIGRWAFNGCTLLTAIVIPDSVTTIGILAFAYCDSLTTASIPSGATLVKDSAGEGPFDNSPTTVTMRG